MAEPIDRDYWEAWARDLGWDAQKIGEAGTLGSQAVLQGMTTAQAMDVLIAVVRDGKSRPPRPQSAIDRVVRLKGAQSILVGVLALAIAVMRLTTNPGMPIFPIAYAFLIVWGLVLFIRDVGRKNWLLPGLGAALSLVSLGLWLIPLKP
jgi:hypothetical protein